MKNASDPEIKKINSRSEFLFISKFGKKAISGGIILQVVNRQKSEIDLYPNETIRLGYIVTKRIGKSVIRNKIKRRIRAAAKKILSNYAKPGYDYVLIGRKKIVDYSFDNINSELLDLLKNTDTLKKQN
ncbi:MAG: Ribonuclease P protein component [Alphaproteobacteria bacterium MarineAlpha2_Bin1]|nr:MAG: Ribonuclease P protein component [Alphaproteobacteria bacterium MarineAlpha2_Bin1]|tara:strand:+ start:679 stop:1065 length:387 start_codon:yes stop_codon:yes gene_type:complete